MGFKKFTQLNEDVDITQLMPQNGPHNAQPQPETMGAETVGGTASFHQEETQETPDTTQTEITTEVTEVETQETETTETPITPEVTTEVETTGGENDKVQINVSTNVIGGPEAAVQQTQVEEPKTELTQEQSLPAKFFSKLFESREVAHIYHLQVKGDDGSHASHLALQTYYEGVLDLIDDLIEAYQGQYDIVEGYENIDLKEVANDKIQYFIELGQFIKQTRYSAIPQDDAHLQAIVDEILILVYKTLYKLRFNK